MARVGIKALLDYRKYSYPKWQLYDGIPEFALSPVAISLEYNDMYLSLHKNGNIKFRCKQGTFSISSDGRYYVYVETFKHAFGINESKKLLGIDDLDPSIVAKIKQIKLTCYDDLYRYLLL